MDYKCLVCGTVFDDSVHEKCPKCGFVALHMVGDVDENSPQIKQMIEEYRSKLVVDYQISVVTYSWSLDANNYPVLNSKTNLPIGNYAEMEPGKIYWIEKTFARLIRDKVTVVLAITDSNGNVTEKTVELNAPSGQDFWKVGVSCYDDCTVKVHLYVAGRITASEKVKL